MHPRVSFCGVFVVFFGDAVSCECGVFDEFAFFDESGISKTGMENRLAVG